MVEEEEKEENDMKGREEDEKEDKKEDKRKDKKEDKKKDEEKGKEDDEGEYVFFENQNPSRSPLFLHLHATHNHAILMNMKKNCFTSTSIIQAIQKLILKLMHFLLIYKLHIYITASFIYSFLAISSIYPKDLNQIQNSLFFLAKYSVFTYCNILYTISIFLCKYLIQNFQDPSLLFETLTNIIKRFTNTYYKNTVLFILSHLLLLCLFAFEIHKQMSYLPSITILDKKKL